MTQSNDPPGRFSWGARTHVMGIVNVTPDSFSGDGLLGAPAGAGAGDMDSATDSGMASILAQVARFVAAGVDILDIGGESTRPGSAEIPEGAETARILPVIRAVRAHHPRICISVDSYKAGTVAAALDAGADWINDVRALAHGDGAMGRLAAARGCPVVLMHNRARPRETQGGGNLGLAYTAPDYGDFMPGILDEMRAMVTRALGFGIARKNIILDPGIGFGKSVMQNLELIARLDQVKALGYPVLLGASRKNFIGRVLNLGVAERQEGSLACLCAGIAGGADIVRVHDPLASVRTARMCDALFRETGVLPGGETGGDRATAQAPGAAVGAA